MYVFNIVLQRNCVTYSRSTITGLRTSTLSLGGWFGGCLLLDGEVAHSDLLEHEHGVTVDFDVLGVDLGLFGHEVEASLSLLLLDLRVRCAVTLPSGRCPSRGRSGYA